MDPPTQRRGLTMRSAFDRTAALAYWEARAQHWQVAAPLAPGAEDVRFYEACAARHVPDDGGDWRAIPLADACIDFAVGDGCYSTFRDLEGPAQLNREVHRVLRPGGEFCLRCFRRPDAAQSVDTLFDWLRAGRFANLDLFRWLLAMALHGDSADGISLTRVWRTWRERVADPRELGARFGWSAEALANMEAWARLESRYFFPTLAQLRSLASAHFDLELCDVPDYEWGEHFPRLLMRRED